MRRFQQTSLVEDARLENTGRPRTSRSDKSVAVVKDLITETPQKSVRSVLRDLGNVRSYRSVYRILLYDLKLFPYTVPMMQHLKKSDIAMRLEFAQWITNNIDIETLVYR